MGNASLSILGLFLGKPHEKVRLSDFENIAESWLGFGRPERKKGKPPAKLTANHPPRVAHEDLTDRVLQHELSQIPNISAGR